MRLTWRGHLVLIAGVAVLFAGTAAGHNQRTDIRQGGVVVAWVSGGGPMPRSWLYCDNETLAYDGRRRSGRSVERGPHARHSGVGRPGRHQRLEGMGQSGAHGAHRPRRKRHSPEFIPLEHRPYCATAPLRPMGADQTSSRCSGRGARWRRGWRIVPPPIRHLPVRI